MTNRRTPNRAFRRAPSRFELLEGRRLLSAVVVGNVFRDANGNGVRDAGEVGQPNIKVFLDYNGNGTRDGDAEPIAVTNTAGTYRFEAATPTTALPIRLLLAGTNFIQTRPANNAARFVNAVDGATVEAESFGVKENVVVPPVVTVLSGLVYYDTNRNGSRQDGEAGRANVSVYIDLNNDGTRQDGEPLQVTNAEGRYRFTGVAAGATTLRLRLSSTNLVQTQPANNEPVRVTVIANQENVAGNFGVAEVVTPPVTTAIVTGNVFYDTNGNAVRDAGETGRANVRVYLDYNLNGRRDAEEPSVLSSATGTYRFENVRVTNALAIRTDLAGTNLVQTLPTGNGARWIATAAEQTYVDQNFGVREVVVTPPVTTAIISGTVFTDLNRNGVRDAGENGRANVSVYLDLNFDGTREDGEPLVVTNSLGQYRFENVKPGTVVVRLRLAGSNLTQTRPANGDGLWLNAQAGKTYGDQLFGVAEIAPPPTAKAVVSGIVFADANANAKRDDGEAGVAGLLVYLDSNMNGRRDAGEIFATTNIEGRYRLEGVSPAPVAVFRLDLTGTAYAQTFPLDSNGQWRTITAGQTLLDVNFGVRHV